MMNKRLGYIATAVLLFYSSTNIRLGLDNSNDNNIHNHHRRSRISPFSYVGAYSISHPNSLRLRRLGSPNSSSSVQTKNEELYRNSPIVLKSFSFIDALISHDQDEDDNSNNDTNEANNEESRQQRTFSVPDQTYSASSPFPQQQMAPLPQEQKQKQQRAAWVERFYEKRGPPPPAPLARPPLVRPMTPPPETKTKTKTKAQTSAKMVRTTTNLREDETSPELQTENLTEVKDIWDTSAPIKIQGCQSLRTWALKSKQQQQPMSAVQVLLRTEGRPLNANVDVWHGPDNTPFKLSVYVEDGKERPFSAIIATPQSAFGSTIAVRNTAETMEFPLQACVQPDFSTHNGYYPNNNHLNGIQETGGRGTPYHTAPMTLSNLPRRLWEQCRKPKTLQGNKAVYVQTYGPDVDKVEILLTTKMRPLQARIEVLQGPNNIKEVMEVFSEDGQSRPFYCVLETPGNGNVIRVVNTADLEFPMEVCMGPFYHQQDDFDDDDDDTTFSHYALPEYTSNSNHNNYEGNTINGDDEINPYLSP